MKKITFKALGLFMAVFAVTTFGKTEKVQASTPELNSLQNSSITTTSHGCGCGCGSCMPQTETSTKNQPA